MTMRRVTSVQAHERYEQREREAKRRLEASVPAAAEERRAIEALITRHMNLTGLHGGRALRGLLHAIRAGEHLLKEP